MAIIVIEELSPNEELLSSTSEVLLDVLTSDSLEDVVDAGMTEVISTPLDDDEDDDNETLVSVLVENSVVALLDSELLSVTYWDVALLTLDDWTDDVVDIGLDVDVVVVCSDVKSVVWVDKDELLSVVLVESSELEEPTPEEGKAELL